MAPTKATVRDWARWRRWAASGAFATVPVGVAIAAFPNAFREPFLWVVLGGLGATAFALSRPSVLAQVFSRAIACVLFTPAAIAGAAILLTNHSFNGAIAGVALGSGAALAFARPALSTKQAHAEFAPVAYRRWFLVSAMACVVAATFTGMVGLANFMWEHQWDRLTVGAFALAASLLASAFGVLRMRSWGVLLGGATTLLVVGAGFFVREAWSEFGWAAVPGMMLGYPVLASRFHREGAPRVREEVRVRVADIDDAALDEPAAEYRQPVEEARCDSRRLAL